MPRLVQQFYWMISNSIIGHIHLVRYEDLSLDPFGTTDKLLKFLDLAPSKLIEKFIEHQTEASRNDSLSSTSLETKGQVIPYTKDNKSWEEKQDHLHKYSTHRNSKATAFKWTTTMKSRDILKVQRACKQPMMMLGYNLMTELSKKKRDVGFPLIYKSSEEIWPTSA